MADFRVISKSYKSTFVMVTKLYGSRHMYMDRRCWNSIIVTFEQPVSSVAEMKISRDRYFSKIDHSNGYWQVPEGKEDRPETAFHVSEDGLLELNAISFFPVMFIQLIDGMFQEDNYKDDILIHIPTWED